MKRLFALMLMMTCVAHAEEPEPGSQYLKAAESGDRRAQYYLADSWFSSGNLSKAEFWAQKSADNGDADACALLAQIKITNPVSLDYPEARTLAEKAVQAGSLPGEITLARILVNTQAGHPDYPKAISLLQNASENLENDSAVDAQMLLGLIYANGVGIPADDDKATWYFKRSSAISRTGYSEYWAGMIFLNGEQGFIEKNKQKALHWLNLSCMEGFDTGCEEFEKLTNG
ncbi:Sel1 family TPR-like repeat protein YjcO [Citrobacter sp. R56]|uniref:Sel1 family TPR-like repeat protein YjcO n=1 Tax=Citrobacter sp. R56 TaxID=1573676 RepID=UPI00193B24FB|nr:Sel1 family TPR-like repeat protein YjcO [Citrobacter sp. R56]QRG78838.1 sel1 repeat family protein [Citrobacter sp. R56]